MCRKSNMSIANFFKKMVQMQSPRIQCCLCAFSVFSALFGMFMVSAGICLILNYNFMEVDTSGLPPHLNNEDGKKVVGIILLCVGLGSLGLSGLVSALYFTACSRPSSHQSSVTPEDGLDGAGSSRGSDRQTQNGGHSSRSAAGHNGHHHGNGGHYHGNGVVPGRASPSLSGGPGSTRRASSSSSLRRAAMASSAKRPGGLPSLEHGGPSYSQRMHGSRNNTPPTARSHHPQKSRHSKKMGGRHQRFQTPLTSHQEVEEEQSLNESRRSLSGKRRSSSRSPERGRVNYGADLNDDSVLTRDHTGSSESSTSLITKVVAVGASAPTGNPPVIIKVDTTHIRTVDTFPAHERQDSYNDGSYDSVEAGLSKETTQSSDNSGEHVGSVDSSELLDNGIHRVSPMEGTTYDLSDLDKRDSDYDREVSDLEKRVQDFEDEEGKGYDPEVRDFDGEVKGFGSRVRGTVREEEEEESGRGSRSTDSLDESEAGIEGLEEAKKRLDDRMQQLIQ